MLGLLAQLQALTEMLRCVAGEHLELHRLRVWLAARLIIENPGLLPFDKGGFDGDLVVAAEDGEALAAELLAIGETVAVVEAPYYETEQTANLPVEQIGPFWTDDQGLVRFDVFRTRRADWISFTRRTIAVGRVEPLFVLSAASTLSADALTLDLPSGTIWISAPLLVPGTTGFVGLRINAGRIAVTTPLAAPPPGGRWVVGRTAPWILTLEPQQPGPGAADGLAFELPARLEISQTGAVLFDGVVRLTDPEGEKLLSPGGAPVKVFGGIRFPLAVEPAEFGMDTIAPAPIGWRGRPRIGSAGLLLPFAIEGSAFGAARHGGLVELELAGGETVAEIGGTTTILSWTKSRLRFAGSAFSLVTAAAEGRGAVKVSTWRGADSQFRIGKGRRLVSLSWNRDGAWSLLLGPGELSNAWDLPRAADDTPLQLPTPNVASLGINRSADGVWLTTLSANVPDADAAVLPARGLTLPNLYLPVHGPRRLAAGGRGRFLTIDNGFAWLKLDARMAEPMLPDPYAASWSRERSDARATSALDILLDWDQGAPPSVRAGFASPLPWPEPRGADPAAERDTLADARFRRHLDIGGDQARQSLKLLDLSSNAQLFGIAIDQEGLAEARLERDSRLSLPMTSARLFLQPQVHWEPVRNLAKPPPPNSIIESTSQGKPGWAGAIDRKPVLALPEHVATRIVEAPETGIPAGALFSLPFGIRAFTSFGPDEEGLKPPPARVAFHAPEFNGRFAAATQIRLEALDRMLPGEQPKPEARMMAGAMSAVEPQPGGPPHVLSKEFRDAFIRFTDGVPVHRLDLSGYGLSCFSRWREDPDPKKDFKGITQVRFDVMMGRTAYQVIEMRSYLIACQCRVVRTIILDRANSGVVERFDSGWKAIEDGTFQRYLTFDTGLVRRFSNIRNIRILDRPFVDISPWRWQAVEYDADAHLGEPGRETVVPIRGHSGYIPTLPVTLPNGPTPPPDELVPARLSELFQMLGTPIGGPVDAQLNLADTLPFHVTGIYADRALAPAPAPNPNFVVAVNGTPSLPRVGQWNCVRVGPDGEAAPVDSRTGVPVIQAPSGTAYRFRAAADAYVSTGDQFGFMMTTEGSRVLFPRPEVHPGAPGKVRSAPPELADAYALSQATGLLPSRARRLLCDQVAEFAVTGQGDWSLLNSDFTVQAPDKALAGAVKWQLDRGLEAGAQGLKLVLGDAADTVPWAIERAGQDVLDLKLPDLPIPHIFSLVGTFVARHGEGTHTQKPDVVFGPALDELKSVLDSLKEFVDLPLPFDIDVRAVPGPTPAFDVLFHLRLRIPAKQHERVDIGIGKFMGQFDVNGQLRAALGGPASGQLRLAFEGDVQQGIIPPALYAGGHFRFAITISDSADPVVELALATTASIGGDLIKGLIEVEITVRYGYTLIPLTLEPGVLLGLEARAKLLSGLLGVSFGVDAMARVKRLGLPPDNLTVTIFAELRVIATIEVLWGLADEEEELHTEFEQTLPLGAVAAIATGNPLLLAATVL